MSAVSLRSPASARGWSLAGKIWMACKAWQARRQHYLAARTLDGLCDHTLKDMGIARSEIHALVYSRSVDRRGGCDEHDAG
jgi:uncharacterized protein YjiS (DUF1127 family)